MNEQINWIKTVLQLCAGNTLDQSQKEAMFLQLKAIYEIFSEAEQNQIEDILLSQLNGEAAIYVYSQMNYFMENPKIKEGLFKAILRDDLTACQGSMVELQARRCIEGFYREHRLLREKNIQKWKNDLNYKCTYIPVWKRNPKRIVIVTGQILSLQHAPTQVVLNFAYILQEKLGYEILIFICPCNGEIPDELWYKPRYMNSIDEYSCHMMQREYRDAVFKGYQIDMLPMCAREYSMMLDLIQAWNPVFVLSLGTINPIVDLVADFTTLVFMDMSINCPVSEAQILVRLGRMDDDAENSCLKVLKRNQIQLFLEEKIPVISEKSNLLLKRENFGLPLESFMIAVVGNRLDQEIDMKFIETMKTILDVHENVAFAIIGSVTELQKYFADERYCNRIFYLGYCTDLLATYGMMDLYLNPDRKGGGFSSSMALTAGIPVVTFQNCDVAYNVGDDFIVEDYGKMLEEIRKYVEDPQFYENQQICAEKVSRKNSVEKLEQYVKNVVDNVLIYLKKEKET